MSEEDGLILVFDMDGVIMPEDGLEDLDRIGVSMNPRIMEVLENAQRGREDGSVAAIFLLTMNGDVDYVKGVDQALAEQILDPSDNSSSSKIRKFSFFDDILCADDEYTNSRGYGEYSRRGGQKIMRDVEHLINGVKGVRGEDLASRVFFFDDHPEYHPQMRKFLGRNFIHVVPPFRPNPANRENLKDKTNYLALPPQLWPSELGDPENVLRRGRSGGGSRRQSKKRKITRKNAKKRSRKTTKHKK